jgi:hypothetical protein
VLEGENQQVNRKYHNLSINGHSGFCGGNSPGNSNALKHGLYIHHKRIRNTNPIEKAGTAPLPYLADASSSRPSAAGARASLLCDNEFVSIEKEEIC